MNVLTARSALRSAALGWTVALVSMHLTACSGGSTSPGFDSPFLFADTPPAAYARVDRVGAPLVSLMLVPEASLDSYNQGNPRDDSAGVFEDDIRAQVAAVHASLGSHLRTLGLRTCPLDRCMEQLFEVVVPDVIRIDPDLPSGFPNGRKLDDPVGDLMLAITLLDLRAEDVRTFAWMPLNPTGGRRFFPDFPHLRYERGQPDCSESGE